MATVSFGTFSKRINSTKQPVSLSDQRTVTLKEDCSQDNPIFICTGNNFNYNYCSWNGHYYFIDDIISLRNNEVEIHCNMDVLATYKSEILATTQFVSYASEFTEGSGLSFDNWLADTRIPLLQSSDVSVSTALTGILSTIGCYILTVVGKDCCTSYMIQSESTLSAILAKIQDWEDQGILDAISGITTPSGSASRPPYRVPSNDARDTCFSALIATIADFCEELGNTLVSVQNCVQNTMATVEEAAVQAGFVGNAYANAPQCIRSCIWVPFDYALAPAGSGSGTIYLGTFNTTKTGVAISGKAVTGSTTINIPWHYSDWRRSVCEDVYLYLPLVGMVQLSADSLTNVSSLTIEWSATYTDGVITYKVLAGSSVIGSYGGQCASNYPMGVAQQASAGEVVNSVIAGVEKTVSSVVNSSLSPLSAGGAILGMATNIGIAGWNVENMRKSTHISCVGGVGGGAGIGLGRECVCFTVSHAPVTSPSSMASTMGRPVMKPMTLSNIQGFCKCANGHVPASATARELDILDQYINGGFYIE